MSFLQWAQAALHQGGNVGNIILNDIKMEMRQNCAEKVFKCWPDQVQIQNLMWSETQILIRSSKRHQNLRSKNPSDSDRQIQEPRGPDRDSGTVQLSEHLIFSIARMVVSKNTSFWRDKAYLVKIGYFLKLWLKVSVSENTSFWRDKAYLVKNGHFLNRVQIHAWTRKQVSISEESSVQNYQSWKSEDLENLNSK